MSNIRRSAPIPLGVVIASVLALLVFFLDERALNTLVFSTYSGLVDTSASSAFFEVAWLLATLDRLLDLSSLLSLLLWSGVIILGALAFRQPTSSMKMTITAPLLFGGVWLLFAYKYALIAAFNIMFFLSFFLYRFLVTLGVVMFVTLLLCVPFSLAKRRRFEQMRVPDSVLFVCKNCGATSRSNPLVCIECGAEGELLKQG